MTDFDIVIDTEKPVDMKSGLETMQGTSDTIRIISETILKEEVPERLNHKSSIRTSLKRTFTGSYGQIFSLDISDELLKKKFRKITQSAFIEVVEYFLSEALYQETKILSNKAKSVLDDLGETSLALINQLRGSPLEKSHDIFAKFNYPIKIRHRKSRDEQTVLINLNKNTLETLQAEETDETLEFYASVTRLNINTGNGRFQIQGENETVAFGFRIEYKHIRLEAKKAFSSNLDYNNGLESDQWKALKIKASPVKLRDGKIVKYIVKGYSNA